MFLCKKQSKSDSNSNSNRKSTSNSKQRVNQQSSKKVKLSRESFVSKQYLICIIIVCLAYILTKKYSNSSKSDKIIVEMKSYWEVMKTPNPKDHNFLAKASERIQGIRLHEVNCYKEGYRTEDEIWGALPKKCGTMVSDTLVTPEEAIELRRITKKMLNRYGYQHYENPESINIRRVKLHEVFSWGVRDDTFTPDDYILINKTATKAMTWIAETFNVPEYKIYFCSVSEMTRFKPVINFQEFRHVDKVRAPALLVTSIIWLSTTGVEFEGGRTEYLTGGPEPFTPLLVEPKLGRFAAWTSGWENPHGVQEMESGERFALLFAITADPDLGYKNMETLFHWSDDLTRRS